MSCCISKNQRKENTQKKEEEKSDIDKKQHETDNHLSLKKKKEKENQINSSKERNIEEKEGDKRRKKKDGELENDESIENDKEIVIDKEEKKRLLDKYKDQEKGEKDEKKKNIKNRDKNKEIEEKDEKDINKRGDKNKYDRTKYNDNIEEKRGKYSKDEKKPEDHFSDKKYKKKLYGFENTRNNCYMNSSLQILTRIEGLKNGILNFDDRDVNKNCITRGKLLEKFRMILDDIEANEEIISPDDLKNEMGKIDPRYKYDKQEDANEFISNFLNALVEETSNKFSKNTDNYFNKRELKGLEEKAYEKFYNKFYDKKGNSFLLDLFYGNFITKTFCESCGDLSVKFNAFNMIELPIYELNKKMNYKLGKLNIKDILDSYFSKSIIDGAVCQKCGLREIYSETSIFKLPENLIIFFGRTANYEYIDTNIEYSETIELKNYMHEKCNYRNYYLDSVIEHSGSSNCGHYTSLCQIEKNIWYYFSDSFFHENSYKFYSSFAIILLYKSSS